MEDFPDRLLRRSWSFLGRNKFRVITCGVRKFGPVLRTGDFAGETGFGSGLAMISDALEAFRGQGR
jgi:hypothetical protein